MTKLTADEHRMIETHIDGMLHTADLDFMRNSSKMVRWQTATQNLNARALVEQMTEDFENRIDGAVGKALAELRDNLEIGTSDWDRHHLYLISAFDRTFQRIADHAEKPDDDLADDERLHKMRLGKCLNDQRARIYRQQAGWNVARRPWHERHWLLAKIAEWAIPAALGAVATLGAQAFMG